MRRSFQKTMKGHFSEIVEVATGQKVIAYMSQVHTSPELAVELFVLEPHEDNLLGEYEHEINESRTG